MARIAMTPKRLEVTSACPGRIAASPLNNSSVFLWRARWLMFEALELFDQE
jgi:hypothetical protein